MRKQMPLKIIKVGIIFIFIFIQSLAFAEEMTFNLYRGLNSISLPFENSGITDAEQLCQVVPYCESVSFWDAQTQKLVTHVKGSTENNFPLTPGYPYFVRVTQDSAWMISGDIPSYFTFDLIATDATDVNTITLPLNRRLYLTTAEELVNDIPNADTVWFWDSTAQGFVGHPKGTEINNFPVYPGYPYFANVIADSTWPADMTAPRITIISPLNGAFVKTTTPNISITFSDEDSGINLVGFNAKINGVDVTSQFTVTITGASYQVITPLPVGANTIAASITDNAGNPVSAVSNFTIGILRAIPGASPTSGYAPLTVHFTTSGEDPGGTIQVFRWDFDGNGTWDTYDSVARDYNYTYNASGTYNATLFVQSSTGQTATATVMITVLNNPPVATASVVPSNGPVPLNVQLLGSGTDKDGTIVKYEWDFDGDGNYDWSSTTTGNTAHTYSTIGTYQAVFRVTDNKGATATAMAVTTVIRANPPGSPTARASATPLSGNAPLNVVFNGTATDPNNDIVKYEWDFNGDGIYDWSSSTSGATSYTYHDAGTYVAYFRVTDLTGLTGLDQVVITVNIQTSLSITSNTVGFLTGSQMTANASSYYSSSYPPGNAIDGNSSTMWFTAYGDTPANGRSTFFEVTFNTIQRINGLTIDWYSTSYMITRGKIEIYDTTGNILYSQEHVFSSVSSQITLPDVANARKLRLIGITSSSLYYVSINEFTVDSVAMGGVEPSGTNINTTLSAGTRVWIRIKNTNGSVIRTLVNNQSRPLGTYSDYWDCKDDNGFVVNDGTYYAVLEYILNGQVVAYDLSNTTGGSQFLPQREPVANWGEVALSKPFEDQFLPIKFSLNQAAEVTLFVGILWTSDTRIRTIFNRVPFPAGAHTVYWDGLDDQGNVAGPPPGDSLILGLWGYTLPQNAVYMTGGKPAISNLAATPNYFSPFSERCMEDGRGTGILINYEVSKDVAQVELRVYDVKTGYLIRNFSQSNVSAGEHTIFWGGRNNNGEYPDIGDYRVGLIARDAQGNESMLRYTLVRFDY